MKNHFYHMLLFFLRTCVYCVMGATPVHSKSVLSSQVQESIIIRRVELNKCQWRSQNAEKITHIKVRLLYQVLILYNDVPFQIGTSLKRKNWLPKGSNSFPLEQFLVVWEITFACTTLDVRILRNGSYANKTHDAILTWIIHKDTDL